MSSRTSGSSSTTRTRARPVITLSLAKAWGLAPCFWPPRLAGEGADQERVAADPVARDHQLHHPHAGLGEIALLEPVHLPRPERAFAGLIHRLIARPGHHTVGVDPSDLDVQQAAGLLDAVEERDRFPDRELLELGWHVPPKRGVEQRARNGRVIGEVGELHHARRLEARELERGWHGPPGDLPRLLLPPGSVGHARSGLQ